MVTKFDRMQISSVNDIQVHQLSKRKDAAGRKALAVPEKEIFYHIFENAKKGNEMAAVLLDEWQKNCQPKDNNEKQIFQLINAAAGRIFK